MSHKSLSSFICHYHELSMYHIALLTDSCRAQKKTYSYITITHLIRYGSSSHVWTQRTDLICNGNFNLLNNLHLNCDEINFPFLINLYALRIERLRVQQRGWCGMTWKPRENHIKRNILLHRRCYSFVTLACSELRSTESYSLWLIDVSQPISPPIAHASATLLLKKQTKNYRE